jgi:hypothetical protein
MMTIRSIHSATLIGLVGLFGIAVDCAASQELAIRNDLINEPSLNQSGPNAFVGSPGQRGGLPATAKLPVGNVWPPQAINRPNPLWDIPMATLTNARERPIFSPSRRPPPPAVAQAPQVQQIAGANQPDRPLLTLVGTIAGIAEGIAIFEDENSKDIVRLRTGESHAGWTLTAVRAREVDLLHNRRTTILAIPSPPSSSN